MNKKGFTLIELLVVIAIIGILASVVLASLNSARSKGSDAAVKANLANMRAQAALYYDNNNSTYGASISCTVTNAGGTSGTCTALASDTTFMNGLKGATAAGGATGYVYSTAAGDAWAAVVPLKTAAAGNWCVDSAGSATTTTKTITTAFTAC